MDTKKRILIVDDEADLTQLIGHQFKAKGFDVQTAADGMEALGKVHAFAPDLIILDMNMPGMGGIEFYSKVCNTNGRPRYPVLVLTARANIKGLFQDLEIDGFLVKPFDINLLVNEAETIIKKRSQGASQKAGSIEPRPRRVCIVDNDPGIANQLAGLFLNADYTVVPAKSGTAAIEKMMKEVPDVALVQLGLSDISGDIVILKLHQMAKTMEVKFILYTHRDSRHDQAVMDRIKAKTGVWTFVEYKELPELLDKANELF